jgi:nicotinate-nucleotide pyrophosphorylase (carboxylating)
MNRHDLIERCYQHGLQLTLADVAYQRCVSDLLNWMLTSDDATRDCTTEVLHLHKRVEAVVVSKDEGVLAGIEEVLMLLSKYAEIQIVQRAYDGAPMTKGDVLLCFTAGIGTVLSLERTILNVLGRMSGIATQTQALVAYAKSIPNSPAIAGTRKTPWMLLDKRAIALGGGLTNRLSLGDAILIKDNHLFAFGKQIGSVSAELTVAEAVKTVVQNTQASYFEIEVEGEGQAHAALEAYRIACHERPAAPSMMIMLDNFGPTASRQFIQAIQHDPLYDAVLFESSGDITAESLPTWAATGVDVVSLGAITHSVKNFNVSMALR